MDNFDTKKTEYVLLEVAKTRIKKRKDFYIHLFFFAIGVSIYVLKTYYNFSFSFYPIRYINCFVMIIWTAFIAIQGLQLLFTQVVFSASWEEKQISNLLKKEKDYEKQIWK